MGFENPLVITGANGHLGRRLIARLDGVRPVRAVVRSERAADLVRGLELANPVDVLIADYADEAAMYGAVTGSSHVVHLVGIIKETRSNRYRDAHEATCSVLARVAERAGLDRVVYMSILGSSPDSHNSCLASKGCAESLLHDARTPVLVLQVPMVLGEDDYASRALRARAFKAWNVVFRASSLEQPIYAGDVVDALVSGVSNPGLDDLTLQLAGPESLTREALTQRGASAVGRRTRVISLPVSLGHSMAYIMERLSANPALTRAMLGVLDHDDDVDPTPAPEALAITLTSLNETLRRCVGLDSRATLD